jgi:hypothetical protein
VDGFGQERGASGLDPAALTPSRPSGSRSTPFDNTSRTGPPDSRHSSARLYVLKAAVDLWLAREAGKIQKLAVRIADHEIDLGDAFLTNSFSTGIERFAKRQWFPLLPVFWQTFLWGWGGFLLTDRAAQEYALLAHQTGIPDSDVGGALEAFDVFFPTEGGWFHTPGGDSRRVLKQMPAAIRGLGAYHRCLLYKAEEYPALRYKDLTTARLAQDHNTGVRLLDCGKIDLVK